MAEQSIRLEGVCNLVRYWTFRSVEKMLLGRFRKRAEHAKQQYSRYVAYIMQQSSSFHFLIFSYLLRSLVYALNGKKRFLRQL